MRTAEQGHDKPCYSRALIAAVENLRDDRETSDVDLQMYVQDTSLRDLALSYYEDGLLACVCPVIEPVTRIPTWLTSAGRQPGAPQ